jgi:hypothetical protein
MRNRRLYLRHGEALESDKTSHGLLGRGCPGEGKGRLSPPSVVVKQSRSEGGLERAISSYSSTTGGVAVASPRRPAICAGPESRFEDADRVGVLILMVQAPPCHRQEGGVA